MRKFLIPVAAVFFSALVSRGQETCRHVYLIPGQGADGRLFSRLHLENCDTTIIKYPVPFRHETLPEYAKRLASQVDTTQPFYLIGVSLGGMCAVEMAKFLHPVKVILISSAETEDEIPVRYRFQRVLPLNRLVGGRLCKWMAPPARFLFEPESRKDKDIFNAMIHDKDPRFMKRSINMIIHWKNKEIPPGIVHIHGDHDHTLPCRRIKNCIHLKDGSHMMIYTHSEVLNKLLNEQLNTK